ncbi:MAG: DUF1513 domain-containing protein [Myxococcales bacterium]|nr:DUF1513 domain-containing protein [Myxococcales bacterium]
MASDRSDARDNSAPPWTRRQILRAMATGAVATASLGCGRDKPAQPSAPAAQPGAPTAQPSATPATPSTPGAKPAAPPPIRPVAIRRGTAFGAGSFHKDGRKQHCLSAVNLDNPVLAARRIPTSFYGHGLAFDPNQPSRALLFEKHGPGCCELDLRAMSVKRAVKTTPDRQFYGHGVFTKDGALLLATETVVGDGSRRGVITVRDGKTLKLQGTFPSFGLAPHDCHLTDDGRTLVVTNGGGTLESGHAPNVAYIDVASRKLIERVPFDSPRVNAGHLALSGKGDLVVVSAPRDGLDVKAADVHGGISFRAKGSKGPLLTAKVPAVHKMRAETLSLAIHDKYGVVAATSPGGSQLSFWDVGTGKLMNTFEDMPQPRGVAMTRDQRYYVVTWGKSASLRLIDAKTLRSVPGDSLQRAWMSGSHVYVI